MNYLPHQQRVIIEKENLDTMLSGLSKFLLTDTYQNLEVIERDALSEQYKVMFKYSQILGQRISRFETQTNNEI